MRDAFFKATMLATGVGAAGTALAIFNAGVWLNYVETPSSSRVVWAIP